MYVECVSRSAIGALLTKIQSNTLSDVFFKHSFLLLDAATKKHIKKGLEIMRVVSVKYSSPNSVSGRFPGFTRAILAKSFPAYAYIGATAPSLVGGSLGAISTLDSGNVKMFLRLYDTGLSLSCFKNVLRFYCFVSLVWSCLQKIIKASDHEKLYPFQGHFGVI